MKHRATDDADDSKAKKLKKDKTCFFCKKSSHYVADCPDIKNNIAGVMVAGDASSVESYDGFNLMSCMTVTDDASRLVAAGLFDGLDPYDVFVDSGANVSM